MRKILILCFMSFIFTTMDGQKNSNSFLLSFKNDEAVIFQKQKLYYLSSLSYDLPFIDEMEFRTELNEFNFRKQEYLFRISPNSRKSIKTQKQFQETIQYLTQMELEAASEDALRERYDLMIDHVCLNEILAIKQKIEILYKDKILLLRRSIALEDFDILDLLEAEEKGQKIKREILDFENNIKTINFKINRKRKSTRQVSMEMDHFLTIEDISHSLNFFDLSKYISHPYLNVHSAKVYNSMLKYESESAKQNFSLGYIQVKYANDVEDDFRKRISIGLGFTIPFTAKSDLNLNNLQIDILETESRYRYVKKEMYEQKENIFQNTQNLLTQYQLVEEQLATGLSEFALNEYQKIAETPPLALLKLRENTLQLELRSKELEYDIFKMYIALLDTSGLLYSMPIKNYLVEEY